MPRLPVPRSRAVGGVHFYIAPNARVQGPSGSTGETGAGRSSVLLPFLPSRGASVFGPRVSVLGPPDLQDGYLRDARTLF